MSLWKGYLLYHDENRLFAETAKQLNRDGLEASNNDSIALYPGDDMMEASPLLNKRQARPMPRRVSSIIPKFLYCYVDRWSYEAIRSICFKKKTHSRAQSVEQLSVGELERSADEADSSYEEDQLPIDVPWTVVFVVAFVWMLYAVFYLLLKSRRVCSWSYDLLLALLFPLLLVEVVWGFAFVSRSQRSERILWIASYSSPDSQRWGGSEGSNDFGEVDWDSYATVLPILVFVIGALTSILGIGGGELIGPLLLNFNATPAASSATTSFMSLLNSSSSVLHYFLLGQVPLAPASAMFVIGAFGGITGNNRLS